MNEQAIEHNVRDGIVRAAKVVGGTLLSAATGYAMAKGIDHFVIPVEPQEVFEVAVAAGSALVGGLVASELAAE